jgi:hypothetical protein
MNDFFRGITGLRPDINGAPAFLTALISVLIYDIDYVFGRR